MDVAEGHQLCLLPAQPHDEASVLTQTPTASITASEEVFGRISILTAVLMSRHRNCSEILLKACSPDWSRRTSCCSVEFIAAYQPPNGLNVAVFGDEGRCMSSQTYEH